MIEFRAPTSSWCLGIADKTYVVYLPWRYNCVRADHSLAFGTVDINSLIDLQRLITDYLWDWAVNVVLALLILCVGRIAANAVSGVTRRILQRSGPWMRS